MYPLGVCTAGAAISTSYCGHGWLCHDIDSQIYWGGTGGYSDQDWTLLPTHGASLNRIADLDDDGFWDIIFANYQETGNNREIDSYLYWGSISDYSSADRSGLPTLGAYDTAVADLDDDGYLDVVVANYCDNSSYEVDSYIYWGSAQGFSDQDRTGLPTSGADGATIADLDQDGILDIVLANGRTTNTWVVDSMIYWGSLSGYSTANRTLLPTMGGRRAAVAGPGVDIARSVPW
ncbi:MAG: VCBS repeat-containing protein [bacterium]